MKTFFSFFKFFFTFRWIKAYRSVAHDSDTLELDEFEDGGYGNVTLYYPIGVDRADLAKSMAAINKGVIISPAGLVVPDTDNHIDINDRLDKSILNKDYTIEYYVNSDLYSKIEESNESWFEFKNVLLRTTYRYESEDPVKELYEHLVVLWVESQIRGGKCLPTCQSCEQALINGIDFSLAGREITCDNCEMEPSFENKLPKRLSGIYKDIVEYEKKFDKVLLERED